MPAPKNNQFWKLRSKHGRDKLFTIPDILREGSYEYFTACVNNPIKVQNWVGKDGDEVTKELIRVFTWSGLATFLNCDEKTLYDYGHNEEHKDFHPTYTHISQIIKTQKFEGAAAGIFNANLISRDLGLAEKQDNRLVDSEGNDRSFEITLNIK